MGQRQCNASCPWHTSHTQPARTMSRTMPHVARTARQYPLSTGWPSSLRHEGSESSIPAMKCYVPSRMQLTAACRANGLCSTCCTLESAQHSMPISLLHGAAGLVTARTCALPEHLFALTRQQGASRAALPFQADP